jgi:hypothetical protein
MAIPDALINACERNKFVWHRESPEEIDVAFDKLSLPKRGELYDFSKRYCLQFSSETLPFQLYDIVEDDGISDNVFYAREELGISPELLPISPYEAESIYVVDVSNDHVVYLTADDSSEKWNTEVLSESFYRFMLENLP